jgi:hypothetical protein
MLSDENRLAAPLPPPALRIVVARFSVVDFDRERISRTRQKLMTDPFSALNKEGDAGRTGCCQEIITWQSLRFSHLKLQTSLVRIER